MKVILYERTTYHESFEEYKDALFAKELPYFASELQTFGFKDAVELGLAVKRAMRICQTAGLIVKQNFRQVFLSKNGSVLMDWRLSELGRKLVLLNGNTDNPFVAKLHIELISSF